MKSLLNSIQRIVNWLQNGGSSSPSDTSFTSQLTMLEQIADAVESGLESKHMADGAVGSSQIASGAVTASKLGSSSVSTVKIASDAVTGPKLSPTALKYSGFDGINGAGACALVGSKIGDKVVGVVNLTDGGDASADFESTITVVDQIQQSAVGDLSTKKFSVLLVVKS